MKNNYFSYALKTRFWNNRQSGGSAAFQKMAFFICVLRHAVSSQNTCIFSVRKFSPFYRKTRKNQDQSSVRYPTLVARADFLIARSDFDAHARKLPAAMVRVDWRIRGSNDQDDLSRMVWACCTCVLHCPLCAPILYSWGIGMGVINPIYVLLIHLVNGLLSIYVCMCYGMN